MPWVRIDDHFDEHPKLAAAGPLGLALWVTGLAYCNRNLTDGFIPRTVAHRLIHEDGIDSATVIARVVSCGLWEDAEGGYRVHDYADYQPSKEEVLRDREQGAERVRRHRENKRASSMEGNATSNADVTPLLTDMKRSSNNPPVPNPVPVPNPTPNPKPEENTPRARAKAATAVAVVDSPQAVVSGFLEELGTPEDGVSPAWKSEQRGHAKRLIEQGFGVDKVRRCTRFMLSETWRTSPFDLGGVWKAIGTWEARGSPEHSGDLKAQRKPHVTDLSPMHQALVKFGETHADDPVHDLSAADGTRGSLHERTNGHSPRLVDTVGSVLPSHQPIQDRRG